ncbi:hypothetical protein HUT16_10135 [Kitasatospora sp. NA04385]|uniref:hypothetical protein n=1 Tax=Kitasatospora sp. NA04385 TaxID=2742135 RepID=UPI00158FFEB0|nr:hypothetical protein [Kitasatospora sp. NA04385]QKW19381.1 hypothetical protein HUT16_10135 [Kitasatospora sp. NA04385]
MRGSSVALTVSVPLEAAATLALPGVAGVVLDAVLAGRAAGWAVGGLAAVLAVGAAASALAAVAGRPARRRTPWGCAGRWCGGCWGCARSRRRWSGRAGSGRGRAT